MKKQNILIAMASLIFALSLSVSGTIMTNKYNEVKAEKEDVKEELVMTVETKENLADKLAASEEKLIATQKTVEQQQQIIKKLKIELEKQKRKK